MRGLIAGIGWLCLSLLVGVQASAETAEDAAARDGSFKMLRLDGHDVRWYGVAEGDEPVVLSYRLVTKLQDFPGARNCVKIAPFDSLAASSGLSDDTLRSEIAAAFAMWEEVAGIAFHEAREGERADILLGAQAEPQGWAFADVFYDAGSLKRPKPISRSLICLNPARRWKVGFDGDLQSYDLRYTIAHEIGHAIGLDHPRGGDQIMDYRYKERFRDLQPGDVRGAVALYGGKRLVPDGSATVASVGRQSRADEACSARCLLLGRRSTPPTLALSWTFALRKCCRSTLSPAQGNRTSRPALSR